MAQQKSSFFPGKEKLVRYYEERLAQHGPDSVLTLDWKNETIQKLRFAILLYVLTVNSKKRDFSILDVGCGLGHLYGFLKDNNLLRDLKIDYLGVDISPKLIESCRKRYPETRFEVADILTNDIKQSFDYVLASGIFNVKVIDPEENQEYLLAMLGKMLSLAGQAAAVNFQSVLGIPHIGQKDYDLNKSAYNFYDPSEVLKLCRPLTERLIMRHDYYPLDFTVYLLKEQKFVPVKKKD